MKKSLLSLTVLLLASSISVSAAAAERPRDPIVLPFQDDRGNPWKLQNEDATYKVKWSFSASDDYDYPYVEKVDESAVLVHSFEDISALHTDNGQPFWKTDALIDGLIAAVDGQLYTAAENEDDWKPDASSVRTTITRIDRSGSVLGEYKDLPLVYVPRKGAFAHKRKFYTVDWKGRALALLDNGLTSLRTDGTAAWQKREFTVEGKVYNASNMDALAADAKGRIFVSIDGRLLCLNDEGLVQWSMANVVAKPQLKVSGDHLAINNWVFRMTDSGLTPESDPKAASSLGLELSDELGGYYEVNEKKSTLARRLLSSGQTSWTYTLPPSERAEGYYISENFGENFVTDDQGNAYVSSNGGTVHALNPQGQPLFSLSINNEIFGYSQIVPISNKLIIIVNNQHILCLEKTSA